jgi:hypothetical protein
MQTQFEYVLKFFTTDAELRHFLLPRCDEVCYLAGLHF